MRVVILGASHAGVAAAGQLRDSGFDGELTLVNSGGVLPYQRPPLSKAYLAGDMAADQLLLKGEKFYQDNAIDLLNDEWASELDLHSHKIQLRGGTLPFDKLILATGSSNRRLPAALGTFKNLADLRDLADADRLKSAVAGADRIVVIGGGFIGLEIAATAAKSGKQVTVIEMQGRLLPRVLTDVMSETILQRHRTAGVDIRLNTALTGFEADAGQITAVAVDPGDKIGADLVITGIGAHANMALAANAGLATSNGIDVDSYCQTSSPDVFAIGDCAFAPSHYMPGSVRLESVQNALDQGRAVAMTIAGTPTEYTDVPWFWSDQYDLKLQMAGLHGDSDETVLRGDPESGRYSLGFLQDGRLTAMHSVNQPADHVAARHLVARKIPVHADQIADTDVKLKQLLKSAD